MTTATHGTSRLSSARPSPPRLALDAQPLPGAPAGTWCPRTRQPVTELTGLVQDLAARGIVATGLSASVADWTGTPGRLHLQERDVRLTWLAYGADHIVVVRHQGGQLTLTITDMDAANAAPAPAIEQDPGGPDGDYLGTVPDDGPATPPTGV